MPPASPDPPPPGPSDVTVEILEVFHGLSMFPGPVVLCRISGSIGIGDILELPTEGDPLRASVAWINPCYHREPDEYSIALEGDLGRNPHPGDLLRRI